MTYRTTAILRPGVNAYELDGWLSFVEDTPPQLQHYLRSTTVFHDLVTLQIVDEKVRIVDTRRVDPIVHVPSFPGIPLAVTIHKYFFYILARDGGVYSYRDGRWIRSNTTFPATRWLVQ